MFCMSFAVIYTLPSIPGWTTWNPGEIHVVYVEFQVVHVESR